MTHTRMTTRLPAALADALASRAEANHRSVNGELCAILQAALSGTHEPRQCHYCSTPEGALHRPDCHTLRKGKSVALEIGTQIHMELSAAYAREASAVEALRWCVKSLNQLHPHLAEIPYDTGLLDTAFLLARPVLIRADTREESATPTTWALEETNPINGTRDA